MTEPDTSAQSAQKSYYSGLFAREEIDTSTPVGRRILGALILALGVLVFLVYVWGTLDTHNYVILETHFAAMPTGVFLLVLFGLFAYIAAFPIKAAVEQRKRSRVRTTMIIVLIVTGIVALFIHVLGVYRYQPTVLATNSTGDRQAAYVKNWNNATLRVFSGKGLSKREVGNIGVLCGLQSQDEVIFADRDTLKVSTPYNDYEIHLDPKTGVPLQHFGARCSDPAK